MKNYDQQFNDNYISHSIESINSSIERLQRKINPIYKNVSNDINLIELVYQNDYERAFKDIFSIAYINNIKRNDNDMLVVLNAYRQLRHRGHLNNG